MIFFKYTYYKECPAANLVEALSLIAVVIGAGIAAMQTRSMIRLIPAFLIFGLSLALRYFLKKAAAKVNTKYLERRIAKDAVYAKYIADTYPDWFLRCAELNPEYAADPEGIPYADLGSGRAHVINIIKLCGLLFLIALCIFVIVGGIWLSNYLKY